MIVIMLDISVTLMNGTKSKKKMYHKLYVILHFYKPN